MEAAQPGAGRAARVLVLAAAVVACGCLAAGCSSAGHVASAISSITASKTDQPTTAPATTAPATAPSGTVTTVVAPTVTTTVTPSVTATTASPTAPASASAATTSPAVTSSPASGGSSSGLLWLVIGICAAAVVIGLIAWLVHGSGRRRAAAAAWRAQVADAYAKGAALRDAIGAAETPSALAAADAGLRWSDIQYRADDLAQTLYALRERAPDEDARTRIANVLAALQAVRSAMSAERVPGGDELAKAAAVRERMSFFDAALLDLREPAGRPL